MVLAAAILLSACAQTPTWADPTEWWNSVAGDDADAMPDGAKRAEDKDTSFPTLGSVPDKPAPQSTPAERRELAKGLVADRSNARYSDETLRAATDAGVPPPPPVPVRRETVVERQMDKAESKAAMLQDRPSLPLAPPTPVVVAKEPVPAAVAPVRSSSIAPPPPSPTAYEPSDRLAIPEIVQRSGRPPPPPTPIEEVSRRSSATAVAVATRPEAVDTAPIVSTAPSVESSESQLQAAVQPAPVVTPVPAEPATPAPLPLTPPAASRSAGPMIDLPIGQDQSALTQAFSAGVAQQNAGLYGAGQGQTMTISSAGVSVGSGVAAPLQSAADDASGQQRLPGAPFLVRFANGATTLGPKGTAEVRAAAAEAMRHGGIVRVVGHASQRTGDMNYARHKTVNFAISLDRANAVAQELRRRGVPQDRIVVEAKGDSDPMFYEFMPNGEAYNRRVEIYLE